MAMWLQKIVLTVVAVVPVIVGEIVRVTDASSTERVLTVAPRPPAGGQVPRSPALVPLPSSALDIVRETTVRRC